MNPWLDKLWKFVRSELGLAPTEVQPNDGPRVKKNWARQTIAVGILLAVIAMATSSWGHDEEEEVPEIDVRSIAAPIALVLGGMFLCLDRRQEA